MSASIGSDLSLRALADECGLSVSHFARAFRQSTGTSPHQWIVERRIEQATAKLAGGEASLAEIAVECGFADQSHFTRVFAKHVGSSPGQWRRLNARYPTGAASS
jgi:AraC-like DNA-binding protein